MHKAGGTCSTYYSRSGSSTVYSHNNFVSNYNTSSVKLTKFTGLYTQMSRFNAEIFRYMFEKREITCYITMGPRQGTSHTRVYLIILLIVRRA
jgi:hypothetical protein